MKPTPMDPDLLAQLTAKTTEAACPQCGAVGSLEIVERYDVTRPDPEIPRVRLAFGPRGRPLWAWCLACNAHGRVAEVPKGQGFPG